MNILFISNDPNIFIEGSAVRVRMRAYADEVARTGGTLHILSRGKKTEETIDGPLTLHRVRAGKISMAWIMPRFARQLISAANIQVVSAQDPFEHGWVAMKAVQGTKVKLHIQVHTDFLTPWFTRGYIYRSPRVRMPFLNRIRVRLAKQVLPAAHGIRAVSERVKNSIVQIYGSAVPVPSVIPIAVSSEVPEAVPLPPHPFTFALIAVGRLEPEKRIEDIVAAIARLTDAYPALGAFIVGEGRERAKLERMIRQKGLEQKIIFLGARADARGLMRSAQAFVQTSAYEGFGMTLIEAALARVPIVTSDVGIVGEVFTGYEHVLCAPVADPTNFAAHIAWLIEDHNARQELIMAADMRVHEYLASADSSPHAIMSDIARLV
jgi:glycosyltransferase involved in cell wall biosynthesis